MSRWSVDGVLPGSMLGFGLGDSARLWWQLFDRALDADNIALTGGEVRALVQIARFPQLSLRELAERMGVRPMTASEFVTRLEARGLVRRTVDPDDRRARRLEVTSASQPVFQKIAPIARGVHDAAVRRFSEEERAELVRLLSKMRDNLVARDAQTTPSTDIAAGVDPRAGGA